LNYWNLYKICDVIKTILFYLLLLLLLLLLSYYLGVNGHKVIPYQLLSNSGTDLYINCILKSVSFCVTDVIIKLGPCVACNKSTLGVNNFSFEFFGMEIIDNNLFSLSV
jgi:hypothetical protein